MIRNFGVALALASLAIAGGCASALQKAARQGDLPKVQALWERGAGDKPKHVSNALTQAAWEGRLPVIEFLLGKGAPVNGSGDCGFYHTTVLTCASHNGQLDAVRLLLDRGAQANAVKSVALAQATIMGHGQVARLLLDRGASASDALSIMWGNQTERHPEIVRLLKQAQARELGLNADAQPQARAPEATPRPAARPAASDADRPTYRARPQLQDFALVVGVEKYSNVPDAPYAERDSAAVRAHLEALGVPPRNVVHLTGSKAVRSGLEKYLEDWLPKMVKPESRVYFYFSGHGAPDAASGTAYLVPWDGDPDFLERTGYPVKRLYDRLAALPAREVLVALDTCFSGAGGRSVLPKGARPLVVKVQAPAASEKLTILTASDANEISGSLEDRGHGAFTYFLLKGLNAGKTTVDELYQYLSPEVQDEARRLNRQQTPQLIGSGGLVLR